MCTTRTTISFCPSASRASPGKPTSCWHAATCAPLRAWSAPRTAARCFSPTVQPVSHVRSRAHPADRVCTSFPRNPIPAAGSIPERFARIRAIADLERLRSRRKPERMAFGFVSDTHKFVLPIENRLVPRDCLVYHLGRSKQFYMPCWPFSSLPYRDLISSDYVSEPSCCDNTYRAP